MNPIHRARRGTFELYEEVRRGTVRVIALGVVQMIAGALGIAVAPFATVAAVLTFALLLLVAAGVQFATAVWARERGGFFLFLLLAIVYAIAGMLSIQHPLATAEGLTLMLAATFMIGGSYRVIIALAEQFPAWGWVVINGLATIVLSVAVWQQWPLSGLCAIGAMIGVDLILNGAACVARAFMVRRVAALRSGRN